MADPAPTPALSPAEPPLVALQVFPKLALAREASLVLVAKEIVHRIDRQREFWIVSVDEGAEELARTELAAFQEEQRERAAALPAPRDHRLAGRVSPWSLLLYVGILAGIFLIQNAAGSRLLHVGAAESEAIIAQGEWWRCLTALFLHGDLSHLAANIAFGVLFAAFLMLQFGAGISWLLIVCAGGLGNAINAWGYRGQDHNSIGASTGVFATLGLLVAGELFFRWAYPGTRTRRHLVVPLGAGLALLAFLGVGEPHGPIDFMAHAWGFSSGLLLGLPCAALTRRGRPAFPWQCAGAVLALALPATAWMLALRA